MVLYPAEARIEVGGDSEDHLVGKIYDVIEKNKTQGQGQDAQCLTTLDQCSQKADSDYVRLNDC